MEFSPDNPPPEWHEWSCHTNYSFLTGASFPHEYVQRVSALGYTSLAITDYDGVYGLAQAYRAQQALRQSISSQLPSSSVSSPTIPKLFYGAELHLQPDHHLPVIFRDTLILLALTHKGYFNLCNIISWAHRHSKTSACIELDELLGSDVSDVVALQPMRGVVRRSDFQKGAFKARCGLLAEHFNGRFYVMASRHLHPTEDCWLERVMSVSNAVNIPILMSQDVFFHAKERKCLSDLLQAVRLNKSLAESSEYMFVNDQRHLQQLSRIHTLYRDLPFYSQALRNSSSLAAQFQFGLHELRYQYPKEMIPQNHTAQSFLEELVWQGAARRFGLPLPDKLNALLKHELDLIERLEFANYFLTVWDIVSWARKQNILCQGRGSAANSAVCYVLGITPVDPDQFDLLFERFISVERGDPPDIDVDFEHERREEVIQYIYSRFGRDKAAMVANVITFRTKGAFRAAGKALGIPESALNKASRLLSVRFLRQQSAENIVGQVKTKLSDDQMVLDQTSLTKEERALLGRIPWKLWSKLAILLRGFPRHLGIHSGGFMLADKPLTWLLPVEPATMPGRSVIQWSKDDIEALGFFKIDVLALGILTAIRKTFVAIEQAYHQTLSLEEIPRDDKKTYEMMHCADTVGVFQIESRAQMSMLPRLRPQNFYDLAIEVAIVRPGPIQGGMIHPFLKRRDGKEPITFPDERLRPILERTLGIPIFQEQVMRIAMAIGDFSAGESNELRKHMGSWGIKGDLNPWLTKLQTGMRKNGLSEVFVQQLTKQMEGFAHYGFPESHAIAFASLAYVSSYLKCHYPDAFFLALLNSQPMGFYAPHALVQAAARDEVEVRPISVLHSAVDCTLERGNNHRHAIRLGLRYVTALSRVGAEKVAQARALRLSGWSNLSEFLHEVTISRSDLTALAAANAFADFGIERRSALWVVEAAPFNEWIEDEEELLTWRPETSLETVQYDFSATSITLGPHPALVMLQDYWCFEIKKESLVKAGDLAQVKPNKIIPVFGMVLVRQAPPSANGMVFFTLEDETGFINLVFTPAVYQKYIELINSQAFLCVDGKVQRSNAAHALLVQHVYEPLYRRADVSKMADMDAVQRSQIMSSDVLQRSRNYM